jgi:hypothetical protein
VQKITNANASKTPNEMIVVIMFGPSLVPVLGIFLAHLIDRLRLHQLFR